MRRKRRVNSAHKMNGAATCGLINANPKHIPANVRRLSASTIENRPSTTATKVNCSRVLKPPQHSNMHIGSAASLSVNVGRIERRARYGANNARTTLNAAHAAMSHFAGNAASGDSVTIAFGG